MHLSKLEIFGFKSFANKTVVNFTRGITGIVGPNGCGKTNIVDAIRWCLGEQKSSTLRSDKMENVIFNGTREKKPMGMAEVSLTIVNDKGILPTDFSEVTITRRIFRSGESEYLLNKNICRLKDITNLFMDTGMGTNAYSVIELKMVETILSNKTEERRRLFEEAAGVNKYKLRRRLSLNKLDEVKKDLTRVNDIVSEVEKTVRSLERQAKKADKYNQIQTELREKELDLARREFYLFSKQLESFQINNQTLTEEKNQIDKQIREIESLLMNFRHEISGIESEFRTKSQIQNELNDKIHNLHKNISVAEERAKSLNSNIYRFEENIKEYNFQKEEIEQNIVDYESEISELTSQLSEKDNQLNERKDLLEKNRQELLINRQNFKLQSDEFNAEQQIISTLQNEISNKEKSSENFNISINKLDNNIQQLTSNIAKSVGYLEDLENEKVQIQIKLKESEENFTRNSELKEKLDNEISGLRVKELEEKNNINNIKDKIEFFSTLINNLEGVSQGTKLLLESEGWTNNEKAILADIGSPKEEYRLAIETVLKNSLNNIVIQSSEDLKSAIEYLRKNDLGKASFIINNIFNRKTSLLDKINAYSLKKKYKKIEKESGFINWALEFIETEEKYLTYFKNSLKHTAVVKSLNDALGLNKKYPEFNFVSVNGEFLNNTGNLEAGSSEKLEDSLFGRRKLLENLKNEYPKLEQNLSVIRKSIEEKEDEVSRINLKVISDQGKILLNEINNIEKQISQLEFEKEKSNQDIDKIQNEIQEKVSELNLTEQNVANLKLDFEGKSSIIAAKKNELEVFENSLNEQENKYSELQSAYNNLQIEIERLRGEIQNKTNLLTKSSETKTSLISSVDRLENEIKNSHQEIESIQSLISDTQNEYDELVGEKNIGAEALSKIEEQLLSKKNESSEYEQKLNNVRNERQTISDNIHEIRVKQSETSIRFENLNNHIKDEYNIELEYQEFEDIETFDFKFVSAEVHDLRDKLKNLGPINLLAYSEYEEENERLEFLLNQRNDLIESEKDLIKTIKEINESAQSVFLQTYDEIRKNFQTIFQSLFNPGDEADLILEEGADPLEAKIEIIAKPKGKRPTGIELLSGGEKTLTATALLFAIYLVKPSPFCIMDEVDAPLDDANVDRFTKLLKDFSGNTQFIIVTHNKRTMEAAENMYGVTIQEEGISKLVGVQFNEEISVSA
ncbi:MAG: chromosome segregation protein SMC [Ignavibacteriales bacterium]|nr:chromosome segregation protein SMC [Ignavibacteriales bacterium]